MAQSLFELLRGYLAEYGYATIALALLLENAGIPVPGETILLSASFLAYSEHKLRLPYIMLVAVCAATSGDSIGFAIGHYGGRPLLEKYQRRLRISAAALEKGERLFAKYGGWAVFVARFIAGMRVFAGPLAGVLGMPWRKFFLFNFLGAILWVVVISSVGYVFGRHWESLSRAMEGMNIAIVAALVVGLLVWWRRRRQARS